MSFSWAFQWYHFHLDPIWPDGTFLNGRAWRLYPWRRKYGDVVTYGPLGVYLYIPHLAPVPKCKDDIIMSSPPQLFPLWDAIRARPPLPRLQPRSSLLRLYFYQNKWSRSADSAACGRLSIVYHIISLQLQVNYQLEYKEGGREFGRGSDFVFVTV